MKDTNVKKSHKGLKILLVILVVLIIGLAVVYFNQKQNIDALVTSVKYSKEDIQQQIDDSKEDIKGTLNEYDIGELRDFTFEEEEQIRKGVLTYDEALNRILEESGVADVLTVGSDDNSSNSVDGNQIGNNTSDSDIGSTVVIPNIKANNNEPRAIVAEYTLKLSGLKAQYLGQIGGLVDQAKADYKQTRNVKQIATKYIGKATSLEKQADSAVDGLLEELKSKLQAVNADISVVDKMKSAYEEEKTLKKSYYLSLYENKG